MIKDLDIKDYENKQQLVWFGIINKLNELIDAANEYEKDREEIKEWIAIVSDLRSRVPVVESRVSILEEYAHPTARTEPVDPYAEQRKWIGKVCKFWDNLDNDYSLALLVKIIEKEPMPFEDYRGNQWYHCEPVKPDDDVIYKGGDNE